MSVIKSAASAASPISKSFPNNKINSNVHIRNNLTHAHPRNAFYTGTSISGRGTGFGTGPSAQNARKFEKVTTGAQAGAITLLPLPVDC